MKKPIIETITHQILQLKDELTLSQDEQYEQVARQATDNVVEDFFELSNGEDPREFIETLETTDKKEFRRFGEHIYNGLFGESYAPPFMFMEFQKLFKNEWLVHFSDNAYNIYNHGFNIGVPEYETNKLGLSTHFKSQHPEPGYNFAYPANIVTKSINFSFC